MSTRSRTRPRIGRALPLVAALAAVAGFSSGCATIQSWNLPFIGGDPREDAVPLELGQWHKDSLHCAKRKCEDWYLVSLTESSSLQVEVYSPAGEGLPDFVLVLEDATGAALTDSQPTGKSPRQLRRKLDAGEYWLHMKSTGEKDEPLNYDILASVVKPKPATTRRRSRPAPKPAPPPEVVVSAEVLEVEKRDGEPRSVLIDAGKPQGLRAGQSGELVEKGRRIAKIEVTDVYEAGSRAEIKGPLEASITIDTRARISVPASR